MDGCGESDEMGLVDRINGEKEEESEMVMVIERWDYEWLVGRMVGEIKHWNDAKQYLKLWK